MPAAVDFRCSFGNQERSTCSKCFFNEPEPILHCIDPFHSGGERSPPVPDYQTYQGEHPGERHAEPPQHQLSEFVEPLGEISEAVVDMPVQIVDPYAQRFLSLFETSQPFDDLFIRNPGSFFESFSRRYGKQ